MEADPYSDGILKTPIVIDNVKHKSFFHINKRDQE
jgi:hypothetical protein